MIGSDGRTTRIGELARLTGVSARLAETRDALDALIEANTRHRRTGVAPVLLRAVFTAHREVRASCR
jgi:hypothetical protein